MCVPAQKAVIRISRVTTTLAFPAEPGCVHSAVLGLPALGTVASSPLGKNGVVNLDGNVPKRKVTDGGWCTSTSVLATIHTRRSTAMPAQAENPWLSSWIHWQCGTSSVWRRWWWPRPVRNRKYTCRISYFSFSNGSSLVVDPLYPLHPCRYCTWWWTSPRTRHCR